MLPFREAFEWLDANLPGTLYLRDAQYGFTVLLTLHVVSMCLFFGLIIMMDLRLVGVANLGTRPAEIQQRLFPWQMFGFGLVCISGGLLFWSDPLRYQGKLYFWIKMGLMGLSGLNAMAIHFITHGSEAAWDSKAARVAGTVSLVLWAGVLVTGRLVAYEWLTYE
ncbi:MAG: hypothetical protein ABL993_01285 [Vicinamibacterales bacterium]